MSSRRSLVTSHQPVAAALFSLLIVASPAEAALTGGAQLAAAYDAILDADFERVKVELDRACPPAPSEACQVLAVEGLWWRILLNSDSRAFDESFHAAAERAIAATDAWTRREPRRAEAWFYLAGSYGPLVQWRVQRGQYFSAAREAKKIKVALERALELDPRLEDAYFGIGLYHYYADVAPTALKILRWLLLLPGGDRVAGLKELLRGRDRGELVRGEAEYQLSLIYLRYERRADQAVASLENLDSRHHSNPLFLRRMAEIRHRYFNDHRASADKWRQLLERALEGAVYMPRVAEVRARLGLAVELAELSEIDEARRQLQTVIDMHPIEPSGALADAERRMRALSGQNSER